jgi:hypothetical protein
MTNEEAVRRLTACHELLERIDGSGLGMTYQPTPEELTLLQGYEEVANEAAQRLDGEGWFDDIRRRAHMAPSASGVLAGVLHNWYASHTSTAARLEHLKRALAERYGWPAPEA